MKKNETKYASMSADELGVRLRELQGKLLTLRTQTVTEKVEDPTAIGKTRREIARVLTARRANQLGIKHDGAAAKAPKAAKPRAGKPKAAKPAAKAPRAAAGADAGADKGAAKAAGKKKSPARKVAKKTSKKAPSKSK